MSKTETSSTASYEENIEELNQIVKRMEAGNLTLEELTSNYENGLRLIDKLNAQLNKARERIDSIQILKCNLLIIAIG